MRAERLFRSSAPGTPARKLVRRGRDSGFAWRLEWRVQYRGEHGDSRRNAPANRLLFSWGTEWLRLPARAAVAVAAAAPPAAG